MNNKDLYIVGNIEFIRKDNSLHYIKDEKKGVIPINTVDNIYIIGHAKLDNEVLNLLGELQVSMHFFNYFENYTGSFFSRNKRTSAPLLVNQIKHYEDNEKRMLIAQKFVSGSASNIMKNLKNKIYISNEDFLTYKYRITELSNTIEGTNNIFDLMAVEGNIRKNYYNCIDKFMYTKNKKEFIMDRRIIRPPNNKMNSLMSFGNSLMYATVLNEIFKTQLNPSISYLHQIQKSRFSLSLDVSEIFKPLIVDRIIFKLINLNMLKNCFDKIENACFLNEKGRRLFVEEYNSKLQDVIYIKELNRKVSYKYLIRIECFKLIKQLTEDKEYKPFVITK